MYPWIEHTTVKLLTTFHYFFIIDYLRIDNNFKVISETMSESNEHGFFNKSIMARVDKNFIPSPSAINCILAINGTDYIKKKQFVYYSERSLVMTLA